MTTTTRTQASTPADTPTSTPASPPAGDQPPAHTSPTQTPSTPPASPSDAQDTDNASDTPTGRAGKDAAKYRLKLRDAEERISVLEAALATTQSDTINKTIANTIKLTLTPEDQRNHGGNVLHQMVNGRIVPKDNEINVKLKHPEDLFTIAGIDAGALIDETGNISQEKIHAAVKELYLTRPELFTPMDLFVVPTIGMTPNTPQQAPRNWQDVIKDSNH